MQRVEKADRREVESADLLCGVVRALKKPGSSSSTSSHAQTDLAASLTSPVPVETISPGPMGSRDHRFVS